MPVEFSLENIKELIDCLDRSSVGKLKIENGDVKLTLEKTVFQQGNTSAVLNAPGIQSVQMASGSSVNTADDKKEPEKPGELVKSPIVGTFYSSSSPKNPPLVKIGQKVAKGDVLCIIESMKLMNEITSEYDGTVAEVLVKNGDPVEFGQPLFRIGA